MEKSYKPPLRTNHSVLMYMNELTHRVVAAFGIPGDRFHLGKIIMQSLKDAPDFVMQIDGAENLSETFGSVLERTIRCAVGLKNLGLKRGDVIVIMAPNHLDLVIPVYAALYLGAIVAGIDVTLRARELNETFDVVKPNAIFCQNNKASEIKEVLRCLKMDSHIITFDKGDFINFFDILSNNITDSNVKDFKPTDFDPEETIALLTSTSGTTGLPKQASLTHKNLTVGLPLFYERFREFPTFTRLYLLVSPLQWLSAGLTVILSPIMRFTRLQTSAQATIEHICDLINKYKPTGTVMSPHLVSSLVKPDMKNKCDMSCFEIIQMGGSAVSQTLIDTLKIVAPQASIDAVYGMSEISTRAFSCDNELPTGSVGRPAGHLQHRLVNHVTSKDIDEPFVTGELWVKGPSCFIGYYNNEKATREIFTEDGWIKTGDLLYRDERFNYYFVDRLKILLKYRNYQISPLELETVILQHPAVYDVVVVGLPHEEHGELPTACVIKKPGNDVTEQEIEDIVKNNLTESKLLRGGVVFMDNFPMTATMKIDRLKVKSMVIEIKRG